MSDRRRYPSAALIMEIDSEVAAARKNFPTNKFLLAALVEEVGELASALQDFETGKIPKGREPVTAEQIRKEAIQVAAMAIRIAEEGSGEFAAYPGSKA